ncbi:NAD(P)/FAD-dependent oxidoreductase [Anatilimnocola sp. NA78]|uniref:NAD(P)/FAD-dependent oxidoreductase n=1 Tax=Anatilimnocola sp. NA78 TaxID=3415683 RepID=UPI003CE49053
MSPKQIVVLGGGFAGLWSAVGAARKLAELGIGPGAATVTLVNRDAYHSIRVRNYEADLRGIRVPLDDVLQPAGVQRIEATVDRIDVAQQAVLVEGTSGSWWLPYDRLVFALGSQLVRPAIPGLAELSFDVDTYNGAAKLQQHLQSLSQRPESPGRYTVIVVGAGLTGIETAAELPARLRKIIAATGTDCPFRVILADHNPQVGSDMGSSARPVIEAALAALGVETLLGVHVGAIGPAGVTLGNGDVIPAATVIWCAGMRSSPLTQQFGVELNHLGQLPVDEFLRVKDVPNVFAAGDSATAMLDGQHASVMSCQHGRPMGRFAGHNVVCDLFAQPMLPLHIDWYVTVLDLGSWGAVYTEGWDRHVVAQGAKAKQTKQVINCQRIYPPLSGNRADILAAAAPVVQRPPQYRH